MNNCLEPQELCLFGTGIAHSRSPELFSIVFAELALPWSYTCVECSNQDEFLYQIAHRPFFAANVTMPFKGDALDGANRIDESARRAGGANLLTRHGCALCAYNTDGMGAALFLECTGIALESTSVAICGTGITAHSIACALESQSARINFLSRSARGSYERYGTARANEIIRSADLIVDATPLGMRPHDGMAFDSHLLMPHHVVLDVVYGHGETALQRAAHAAKCTYFNGEGMLVGQAAVALPIILDAAHFDCVFEPRHFFAMMEKSIKVVG